MKIKQMIKWNWQNSYMGLIVLYGVFILLYLFENNLFIKGNQNLFFLQKNFHFFFHIGC